MSAIAEKNYLDDRHTISSIRLLADDTSPKLLGCSPLQSNAERRGTGYDPSDWNLGYAIREMFVSTGARGHEKQQQLGRDGTINHQP